MHTASRSWKDVQGSIVRWSLQKWWCDDNRNSTEHLGSSDDCCNACHTAIRDRERKRGDQKEDVLRSLGVRAIQRSWYESSEWRCWKLSGAWTNEELRGLAGKKCGEASPHTSLALCMREVRFAWHDVQKMADWWHTSAFQRGHHNFGAKYEYFDTPRSM
jgi:hypothetical protein